MLLSGYLMSGPANVTDARRILQSMAWVWSSRRPKRFLLKEDLTYTTKLELGFRVSSSSLME